MPRTQKKMLGDAGEHYALSQFGFVGNYAAKMPDNWEAYDLVVETGTGLHKVSVKTRSESQGWKKSRWFNYDDRKPCDWFVFIFISKESEIRSWVIPFRTVLENSNVPGKNRKDSWFRDISWIKLNGSILSKYENNWSLAIKE